ncbi:endonuclease MutS2 [Roseivirga misakiensis]|uniref:Endonuclease MutS2 n=1 Tax=Roseivirga misakiensis TaxID=1563681 RepID=A0A1E5SKM9_9BACT|nr:endonuclease MutS2 [Roseivirga misakiensis]OEJ99682.1 DNA mismatch repair protein MutS [Roseivirga misakiensis]
MLYPKNLESKLGFDKIRLSLQEACESNLGHEFVHKIKFSSDRNLIDKWLSQTDEFVRIIESGDLFPNSNYIDISTYFNKARVENSHLAEEEFFDIVLTLKTLNRCLDFFREKHEDYPVLSELTHPVYFNENLLWSIDKVFDERGKLKDNASDKLYQLRKAIASQRQRLRGSLDRIISHAKKEGYTPDDLSITIRNGRMVIPLYVEHKRRIKGLVHGESATGQTVYLEPNEVFEINNEVQELEYAEQREVVRILTELTDLLRPEIESLQGIMKFLGLIDFIRAKARYALSIEACKPQWSEMRSFDWLKARHPLLLQKHKELNKPVVPLTIGLNGEERIVIISGPNAGGKSVCLKTVGLLQYMFQCGLLVSVDESSTFTLFRDLFIDIGDEQSIENDLSTYSSHLINMKNLLSHVNKKSLFLIDEFGTGTEPQYGGAIAEAILMELNAAKGMGVITTHYGNLKDYADKNAGLANGAMRYDIGNLQPLYELEVGKPGSSFALEIATKIGLPKSTIEQAKRRVGVKQVSVDKMLGELQSQKQAVDKAADRLKSREVELEELTAQYRDLKTHLEKQERKVLNAAKKEAQSIISNANKEVEKAIRVIKEKEADKRVVKAQREKLDDLKSKHQVKEALAKAADNVAIEVGDYVMVKGQETVGQVAAIKGKDAELKMGALTSFVKLNRLEKVNRKAYKKQGQNQSFSSFDYTAKRAGFSAKLDIRGKRAEEVISILDQWLDEAILLDEKELQILHGKGNGVLRQVARNHLSSFKQISSLKDEHVDRGGAGITVVRLK